MSCSTMNVDFRLESPIRLDIEFSMQRYAMKIEEKGREWKKQSRQFSFNYRRTHEDIDTDTHITLSHRRTETLST